jgi:hypothetical protein
MYKHGVDFKFPMTPMPDSRTATQEIDHRTLKLVVGLIALTLPGLTNVFASGPLSSISASYYEQGWSQSIFIGFLFAIASFLLAYNGTTPLEMLLGKIACAAALGVALFPCECGHQSSVAAVHYSSAAIMFVMLAFFCYAFYRTAMAKGHIQARVRAAIYLVCGIGILAAIAAMGLDALFGTFSRLIPQFTFYGEATGLIAFGISWLTASRVLPVITAEHERFSPFAANNPK